MGDPEMDRRRFLATAGVYLAASGRPAAAKNFMEPADLAKYLVTTPKDQWGEAQMARLREPGMARQVLEYLPQVATVAKKDLAGNLDFALRLEKRWIEKFDADERKASARRERDSKPREGASAEENRRRADNATLNYNQKRDRSNADVRERQAENDQKPVIGPMMAEIRSGSLTQDAAVEALNRAVDRNSADASATLNALIRQPAPAAPQPG